MLMIAISDGMNVVDESATIGSPALGKIKRFVKEAGLVTSRFLRGIDFSRHVPRRFSVRKAQVYGLFALCALASWLRGGTHPALQSPLWLIAIALCLSLFFLASDERARIERLIKADPVFRFGSLLLLVIVVQSLNSNYSVVSNDAGLSEMTRISPRLFPWSVEPGGAREMLVWFFPALVGALIVRHLFEWRHIKFLLHLLMWNAALLAFVGLIQYLADSDLVLGIWRAPSRLFFATFDYVNHAAEWFYLNAFIALALLKDNFEKHKPPMQAVVWAGILLLCVVAALLTLSRFGAVIALSILFVALSMVAKRVLRKVSGTGTANVAVAIVIVAMLGVVLFLGAGGGSLAEEVGGKSVFGESSVANDLGDRVIQMPLALAIFGDSPLFGSGGWGYRWLASLHVHVDDPALWTAAGLTNVHCDPIQFLSEFGLVGTIALVWVLVQLVTPAVKKAKNSAISLWIGVGIGVIALHSLIDLPFRCPAVLYLWVILLAALPLFPKRSNSGKNRKNKGECEA